MNGNNIRGMRTTWDDGRGLPYHFVTDDWFGGFTATDGGGFNSNANGTPGDDVFTGTDAEDEYHGLAGNDTIDGGKGGDRLYGDDGNDTINGGDGNDYLNAGLGRDVIRGGHGDDAIISERGEGDVIYGGKGDDSFSGGYSLVYGGSGNDSFFGSQCQMHGGSGNDYLRMFGAFDKSELSDGAWGGSGADTFAFTNGVYNLLRGEFIIHDLENADLIDLSELDANSRNVEDQSFRLVPQFSGRAGDMTIRYDEEHGMTLIELYTDKDMTPDGTIFVPGDHTDFVNFVF